MLLTLKIDMLFFFHIYLYNIRRLQSKYEINYVTQFKMEFHFFTTWVKYRNERLAFETSQNN